MFQNVLEMLSTFLESSLHSTCQLGKRLYLSIRRKPQRVSDLYAGKT